MSTKEVGILLKVGATGLENLKSLSKELQAAGVETQELDARAAALSAELQQLTKQQSLIDAFARQKKAVGDAAAAMGEAQATAQRLGKELAGTEEPTKKQERAFASARAAARAASEAYEDQQLVLQRIRGQLTAAGISTTELAAAQTKASAGAAAVRGQLEALKAEYQQLGTQAAAAAQSLLATARAAEESRAAAARMVGAARSAGEAISGAFAQTGVRSLQAIEAEIADTERAVSLLQRRFASGAISATDLARAVGAADVKLAALKTEIATVPALPGQFEAMSARLSELAGKFGALSAAVATVGLAVRPVIDATVALDQMRRVLTTVSGSAEAAEKQIEFVRRTAQSSGLAFDQLGESYGKFAASAAQSGLSVKQIQDVFGAVSLAAGNLGLSTEQARNALNALGQMASKGVVSMEELRQQLGDALPGVLPALAKELGLMQAELAKVVESGQLLSSEAIPAIGRSLRALQPETGVVNGLVASWYRFINVIKEAGTTLAEGPLGSAAGVVVTAFAGVIRDLSVVAVGASEAFKLLGLSVLSTFDLLRGDITFEQLKQRLQDFTLESAKRIEQFKETAYGAGEGVKSLGTDVLALGTSFARLALDQQRAIDTAALAAQSSEKNVAAAKAEAAAVTTLADLLGDEAGKRQAAAQAAELVLDATRRQLAADEAVVATLTKARDATIAKAAAEGTNKDAIKATVEALNDKIAKATADAGQTRAQAEAARASAAAMDLAAKAAKDNSSRIKELRQEVEDAEVALTSQIRALRLDATTQDDVKKAAEALAKAKGLLRDAIDDLDAALKRQIATLKVDLELKRAGLELELAQAKNDQRRAQERGLETSARLAGIRIGEIEKALRQEAVAGTLQEAEATLKYVAAKESELRKSGQLTPEKQLELDLLRKGATAIVVKTSATVESNKAADEELERLKRGETARGGHTGAIEKNTNAAGANTRAVGGNSSALDQNAQSAASAASSQERFNNALRDAPAGRGITSPRGISSPTGISGAGEFDSTSTWTAPTVREVSAGQAVPPDGSGGWQYTIDPYKIQSPGFDAKGNRLPGGWYRNLTIDGRPYSQGGGFGSGFGGGGGTSAPANPPQTIVLDFGGRRFPVETTGRAAADQLVRALEEARRQAGG